MEISIFLGDLHPRLVPFPVVLLLFALVFDGAGLIFRSERAHWCGKVLMFLGTVTLLLAFICGICAEIWAGRAGVPHHQIKWHELAATFAAWGFIGLTAWRIFLNENKRGNVLAYVICGFALYGMVALAGWLGGELVQEYGASVRGAEAKTVLSMHDLNTLAQRQTDRNLEYSDIMHRSAGVFVLALTLAIFVRTLWPQHAGKVRWVGPALLTVGGVLLFFTADLDLYALTDPRQFMDREAQAHKLISIILAGVGIRMWVKQRRSLATAPTEAQLHFQHRMVAVVALIGGGILFTHVHTVAPYANVAAGVYINHIVMGFVALAIGAVKLLEDTLPIPAKAGRARALLFPALLGAQSFLLLTYTEGIPWWAGVGHYNRWGPNGGNVAPFGKERAELVFDAESATMELRVLQRFKDEPVRISATNVNVLVRQRYQETAVPLQAVDAENGTASHFRGHAVFLKDALQFDARVALPLRGKMRTGYFDPWVTPAVVGIPPNEVAKFVCPMHEGVRSTAEADCRLCGMPLVPIQTSVRTTLHDPQYAMKLALDREKVTENRWVTLTFSPQHAETGEILNNLLIVHEYPLHLIITTDDLSFFDHVHPEQQPDGTFVIDYKFPRGGTYILFAEITPSGDRAQVFRLPVEVEGERPPPKPVKTSPALAREIRAYRGDLAVNPRERRADVFKERTDSLYHVELIAQPRRLVAQRHANFAFRLTQNGRPVTDLRPYIGAMGHCVILSEDGQMYLHSHPEQLFTVSPDDRGGPEVAFHTEFPRAGRYKIWGQFLRGDEVIVADFVVEVGKPILPRWLVNFLIFD
jgi:uncharacterized membrane protein